MKDSQLITSGVTWSLSFVGGFMAAFYLIPGSEVMDGAFRWLTCTLLPFCFLLALATPRLPWLCPILAFCAITAGIGADAMTDKTMDRNLWGIEAILAQALAFPGAAIGGAAGAFLSYRIRRKTTAQPATPPYSEPAARSPQR